jgi:hypothetical protein
VLKFVVIGVLFLAIFSYAVMTLWNWLMPVLFGLRLIDYWQALGILVLSKLLFGGYRGRPGSSGFWRHRMMARWEQMTPEEREKFRAGLRGGCGFSEPPPSKPTA